MYTYKNAQVIRTASSTIEGNKALPVPVGLITMDEVIYAGGFGNQTNNGYWLNVGRYYWTMSPFYFRDGNARVFIVTSSGCPTHSDVNEACNGVRPVINLKAGTTFTFNDKEPAGTTTNPYIVNTD